MLCGPVITFTLTSRTTGGRLSLWKCRHSFPSLLGVTWSRRNLCMPSSPDHRQFKPHCSPLHTLISSFSPQLSPSTTHFFFLLLISPISLWVSCHCENMICSHQTDHYSPLQSHQAHSPPSGPCIQSGSSAKRTWACIQNHLES